MHPTYYQLFNIWHFLNSPCQSCDFCNDSFSICPRHGAYGWQLFDSKMKGMRVELRLRLPDEIFFTCAILDARRMQHLSGFGVSTTGVSLATQTWFTRVRLSHSKARPECNDWKMLISLSDSQITVCVSKAWPKKIRSLNRHAQRKITRFDK